MSGKAKTRRKTLTTRQKEFLRRLAKGSSLTDAADGLYSGKDLANSGHQAFKTISKAMPDIMDKYGLSDAALVRKYLKPALTAMETEFAKFEGKISDSQDVIAWGPRLTALDLAFKLKGSYAATKAETDLNINDVRISIVRIGIADRPAAETGTTI